MRYELMQTDWGHFAYVAESDQLVATFLPGPRKSIERAIRSRYPDAVEGVNTLPRFKSEVDDYFNGVPTIFTVCIGWSNTSPFYRRVLEVCRRIPFGQTASYADLARAVGQPGAARAVGGAMRSNRMPLVVPCHRVLSSDGALGGFSAPNGSKDKLRLLRHENPAFGADARPRRSTIVTIAKSV